ncbi:MAG: hypothetical protein Q8N03_02050 [Ignavibacteria bacterium]|nr:hypothetical protein [Ignavibacteria bacterium]
MLKKQNLILPLLLSIVLISVYFFYFSPFKGLGSFADYDRDSHVQKEIVVKLVMEKGIQKMGSDNGTQFYVEDRNGTEMLIQTTLLVPAGIENSEYITLTGHICNGSFEVVNLEI